MNEPDEPESRAGPLIRLAWFVGLWLAGVLLLGTVGWLIRLVVR